MKKKQNGRKNIDRCWSDKQLHEKDSASDTDKASSGMFWYVKRCQVRWCTLTQRDLMSQKS